MNKQNTEAGVDITPFDDISAKEKQRDQRILTGGLDYFARRKFTDLEERNHFLEDTRRAIFNVLEDVTLSEEDLRKKTEDLEKYRQAVDTSFDHTIITDENGRILYANRAAELLTGYSKEEIIGNTPALWGKQMPAVFYETMWRTIKTEKNSYAGELTNKRKDGTKYLASVRITPIFDKASNAKFFVGVERDITEERESQLRIVRHTAQLEQANAYIETEKKRAESILRFLKSIGEGVYATDLEGKVIFMNETAELISGKIFQTLDQKFSESIFTFMEETSSAPRRISFAKKVLSTKRLMRFSDRIYLVHADKKIPLSGTCSPIRDENGKMIGTITVFQDVTKKHELDQMKDGFLSVAAHQLRTPLGGMRWNMEMLLEGDMGKLSKAVRETVGDMYENSKRMITIVNDLLNVSRIDQHGELEKPQTMDIVSVLQNVEKTLLSEAKKRLVTVSVIMKKKIDATVLAPPKHIYGAFENLIANAIRYNQPHGSVEIAVELVEKNILVTVVDTGIGIPKDAQSKIFSKFFRAPNAALKETDGSGLGLFVVKSYVEEAKGKIWFTSEEGKGTTFFVELPRG